jgi:hypothetical protein
MTTRKLLLNNFLDIGGVATLNNLYSQNAKTFKGGLLFTRKLFKSYLQDGLIEKIEPIGRPANKAREVFYCLTKKGTDYIGRSEEYKYRKYTRSPANIMHESMKFDIALSFLRLYPNCKFTFRYDSSFYGVRPDILIRIDNYSSKYPTRFLLVEIERKKTVDRVFHEKIKRYEEMFQEIASKKSHNISQFTALFVYTDIWFDVFLRPQQYNEPKIINHINFVNGLLKNLVNHYCKNLHNERYCFMSFHDFYRLNEPVWFTPLGNRVVLLSPK